MRPGIGRNLDLHVTPTAHATAQPTLDIPDCRLGCAHEPDRLVDADGHDAVAAVLAAAPGAQPGRVGVRQVAAQAHPTVRTEAVVGRRRVARRHAASSAAIYYRRRRTTPRCSSSYSSHPSGGVLYSVGKPSGSCPAVLEKPTTAPL